MERTDNVIENLKITPESEVVTNGQGKALEGRGYLALQRKRAIQRYIVDQPVSYINDNDPRSNTFSTTVSQKCMMTPKQATGKKPTKVEFLHPQPVPGQTEHVSESSQSNVLQLFSKLLFWGEKYNDGLETVFQKVPENLGSIIASIAMFVLGITARGEWLLFAVYVMKYVQTGGSDTYKEESDQLINSFSDWVDLRFKGFITILIPATAVSYLMYFGVGGFLHWYYYVRQRDRPETWKCQPDKWLSPADERHEIMVGSFSLIFGSIGSAALATYVMNGGWTTIYFNTSDYGYIYLILQVPLCFIWQDYMTYWHHRTYHTPWLYKNFHKLHHTYKQPTAFSVTAIHPIEFMHMQAVMISPMFLFPVYWLTFSLGLMYIYYHGIIDHSGINFKRHWWQPWQPDCIFHDNHHQYFHVNFGFNCELWDKIHGTYRRKDRIYREDIFYGFGKSLNEASPEELKNDIMERKSENPKAYQGDKRCFDLDETEIKEFKKTD